MSKLYVFGIGGTGSRVIKALTFLLASGVDLKYDLVPIIIDPDKANGDLTRTIDTLKDYKNIHNSLGHSSSSENTFFKTKMNDIYDGYIMEINDTQNKRFKEFINYSNLSRENRAMIDILFSEKNLNSEMNVGFKGNPNIGSVVLNQFDLDKFGSSFQQGDLIFIVSSIFGGTGASGFPLLLKKFRSITTDEVGSPELIKNSVIGAISVLPYFGVQPDSNSQIDKSTFISKTKAALKYYETNISNNNSIDYLYYIGDPDSISSDYPNSEGGAKQKNNAHFIELASALAILDFTRSPKKQNSTKHKEFGIDNSSKYLNFSSLNTITKINIKKPLSQYSLFVKYMFEKLPNTIGESKWTKDINIDSNFLSSDFYQNLKRFNDEYKSWLNEMGDNIVSFKPINLDQPSDSLFNLIDGEKPSKVLSFDSNYNLYESRLNKYSSKFKSKPNVENKFIETFYKATEKLVSEKLKIK